jgi:hypothetical protein
MEVTPSLPMMEMLRHALLMMIVWQILIYVSTVFSTFALVSTPFVFWVEHLPYHLMHLLRLGMEIHLNPLMMGMLRHAPTMVTASQTLAYVLMVF